MLNHVPLFATSWTELPCHFHQTPLSVEFSRQYWSGLPFPTLEDVAFFLGMAFMKECMSCGGHLDFFGFFHLSKCLAFPILFTTSEGPETAPGY